MNLIKLINKNFKIMLRNKISFLFILFGPLLVVLIAGLVFNNNSGYDINIGVYSDNYSSLSNNIISDMEKEFKITEFQDEKLCIDSVKSKGYHGCLIFPPFLEVDNNGSKEIDFYFDNSKVNIASAIKQGIYNSIRKTSNEISQNITQSLISSIGFAEKEIDKDIKILEKDKKRLKDSKALITSSRNLLSKSNVEFDKESLSLNQIENYSDDVGNQLDNLTDIASDAIEEFESFVEDADDSNCSGLSSDISSAEDAIDVFKEKLENSSENRTKISDLSSSLDNLIDKIESLDNKLDDAKAKKSKTNDKLSDTSSKLKNSITGMKNVLSSLKNVKNVLQGNDLRNASSISNPVEIVDNKIVGGSNLKYIFPNLIVLVMMFFAIIMSATQVINEKLNRSAPRMRMSPNPFMVTSIATFFTMFMISLLQIIMILLLAQFVFGINIMANIYPISSVLIFTSIFFILIGIGIGLIFNSEHSVMLSSISISSFFFIVSDLILPIETMPSKFIAIMNYTPFILSTSLLRKVMFFDKTLQDVNTMFYYFVLMSFTLFLIFIIGYVSSGFIKKMKAKKRAKFV
ncbi:MAG: ABC transporter permease [Nanobdellota archaeon]